MTEIYMPEVEPVNVPDSPDYEDPYDPRFDPESREYEPDYMPPEMQ